MKQRYPREFATSAIKLITFRRWLLLFVTYFLFSCKKLVEIGPPANSITTSQTFADSANATSAILGIYSKMSEDPFTLAIGNGAVTTFTGIYSDELVPFGQGAGIGSIYSCLLTTTGTAANQISNFIWKSAYSYIYQANACIDGLEKSTGISSAVKNHLIAETKFLRAFIYFNLVNIFGDVPYVTSINFRETAQQPRTPTSEIYSALIADLESSKDKFLFEFPNGMRSRASKWSTLALLSRLYLYNNNNWAKAEETASAIINRNDIFILNSDLNKVFEPDGKEAILQWYKNRFNVTAEGFNLIPFPGDFPPYRLSNQLLAAFETNDKRRQDWVKYDVYNGNYYFPYKYKNYRLNPNGSTTENYTILRLAEQFLIRAEARAQQNNLSGATSDLNVIRNRAGLPNLSDTLTQAQVLDTVSQERRIELFAEWGHRWYDLKRTGKADAVMSVVAPLKNGGVPWQSFRKLWPIPNSEIFANPFLVQNPAY